MPEPLTLGLGAMGAYLIPKLLGPTADYLGVEMQALTEKRVNNIKGIFLNARDKLSDRKLNGPGAVSPKVLKIIINDGSYSDDALSVEYFGGVLASSKAEVSRDDRGSRLARAIDVLSTYQLALSALCRRWNYSALAQQLCYTATRIKCKCSSVIDLLTTQQEYTTQILYLPERKRQTQRQKT